MSSSLSARNLAVFCFTFSALLLNRAGAQEMVLAQGFDGPVETQGCDTRRYIPPDPTIAVGVSYIIVTVNSFLYGYDRSNLTLAGSMSLEYDPANPGGLIEAFGQNACPVFDPRCAYDHYTQSFVISAMNPNTQTAFLAVFHPSTNPSVRANWDVHDERGVASLVGFPSQGYDHVNYHVAVVTQPSGTGSLMLAFPKSSPDIPFREPIPDARPLMAAVACFSR